MTAHLASVRFLSRLVVALVVATFLAVQIPSLLGPPVRGVSVGLSDLVVSNIGGNVTVSGNVTGSSGGPGAEMRVVVVGQSWSSRPASVYIYYDTTYPPLGQGFFMNGLVDHLGYDLRARGLPSTITVLDAPGLAAFLRSNATGVLVLATTALPDLVFSHTTDLLTPWIRRGGTVIWVGELIGGFTVTQGEPDVAWDSPLNLQWTGETEIFGSPLVREAFAPEAEGVSPSPLAAILGLRFSLDATGADTALLGGMGGLDLGWVGTGFIGTRPTFTFAKTSIAAVHVDNGTVVLFGYAVTGPGISPNGLQGVTHDIAQILASGVLYTDYHLDAFASWSVPIPAGGTQSFLWRAPMPGNVVDVSVFAYVDPCAASDPSQCLVGTPAFARAVLPVV